MPPTLAKRLRHLQRSWTQNLGPLWWACAFVLLLAAGWLASQIWTQSSRAVAQQKHQPLIERSAQSTGLSQALINAIIFTESSGDPNAHSSADARGLMQITPITHRDAIQRFDLPEANDEALFEPSYNIDIGTRYLSYLLKRFDGDLKLALAAYHMGPTAIARLRLAHPNLTTDELLALDGEGQVGPKTRAYVANVIRRAGMETD